MVPAVAADRVALLIGNDDYRDENSRLLNAARDARDLGAALGRLGFRVILRQNADLDAMRGAVREFGATLDRATVALFFYAGHAIQVNGNNYLIPTNFAPRSEREVMFDGLELSPIIWMMGERTKKIVILDACRDNPFKELRASTGLAQAVAPPDTLIAYATAPNCRGLRRLGQQRRVHQEPAPAHRDARRQHLQGIQQGQRVGPPRDPDAEGSAGAVDPVVAARRRVLVRDRPVDGGGAAHGSGARRRLRWSVRRCRRPMSR